VATKHRRPGHRRPAPQGYGAFRTRAEWLRPQCADRRRRGGRRRAVEIDDAYAERFLRTRGLAAGARDDAAALFIAAVADLGNATPAPTGSLARLLDQGFVPTVAPVPAAVPPRRRRDWRLSRALVAVLAGSTLIGLASGASAGILPGPLQDQVGGLLEATTPFEFPRSDQPAPAPRDTPTPPQQQPVPSASVPAVVPVGPTPSTLPTPVPDLVDEPAPLEPTAPQQPPTPGTPPTPDTPAQPFPPAEVVPPGRNDPAGPPSTPPAVDRAPPGPRQAPQGAAAPGAFGQQTQGNSLGRTVFAPTR
jgi:hypothetical protein